MLLHPCATDMHLLLLIAKLLIGFLNALIGLFAFIGLLHVLDEYIAPTLERYMHRFIAMGICLLIAGIFTVAYVLLAIPYVQWLESHLS